MGAEGAGRALGSALIFLEGAVCSRRSKFSHNKFRKKVCVKNCAFIGVLKGTMIYIFPATLRKAVGSARRHSKTVIGIRYGL